MQERRDYTAIVEGVKAGITPHLEDIIGRTVNGKIDKIDVKLTHHIENDTVWKSEIERKLDEMKPLRYGLLAFKNFKSGAVFLAGLVVAIGVIFGALAWLVKFLMTL